MVRSRFFKICRQFILTEGIPGIIRSLKEGFSSDVFRRGLFTSVGHGDADAALIRDLLIGIELEALADFDRENNSADVSSRRIHVIRAAGQSPCAGLVKRRGADCVDSRAALCQFRRVEVRVGDVHQDVLRKLLRNFGVDFEVIDSVLFVITDSRNLFAAQSTCRLIGVKTKFRASPHIGDMAKSVCTAVIRSQDHRADLVAGLYIVRCHTHLIVCMGRVRGDRDLRRAGYGVSCDRSEGHVSAFIHGQFLVIGGHFVCDIEAVIRSLKKSISSVILRRGLLASVGHGTGYNRVIGNHKILII